MFNLEKTNIVQLLERVKEDLSIRLVEKHIEMKWQVPEQLEITGNENLLYSLFRNLTDNAIRLEEKIC